MQFVQNYTSELANTLADLSYEYTYYWVLEIYINIISRVILFLNMPLEDHWPTSEPLI